jgi:hypothetical protein
MYDITSADFSLYMSKILINSNNPDSTATCGSVVTLSAIIRTLFFPGNLRRANGYAAKMHINNVINDVSIATTAELKKEHPNVLSFKT